MPSKSVTKLDLIKELPRGGSGPFHAAFSPDGQRFAVGFYNSNLLVHSIESQKTLWKKKGTRGVKYGVAFSPDGRTLATCGPCDQRKEELGAQVLLWDANSGQLRHSIDSHVPEEDAYQIGFLADGSSAVSLLLIPGERCRLVLIRVATGKLTTLLGDEDDINCFAASPKDDELAVGRDKQLEFRSVKGAKCRKRVAVAGVYAVGYSPDGQLVAALERKSGAILVFESKSGKAVGKMKYSVKPDNREVDSLSFDREAGELVVCHGRGGIYVLDLKSGKLKAEFQAPWTFPYYPDSSAISLPHGLYADVTAKTRLWRLR